MKSVDVRTLVTRARERVSRWRERRRTEIAQVAGLRALPIAAQLFVISVIALGAGVIAIRGPREVPDWPAFLFLLVASSAASGMRLRLPLGTSASNLSVSYTFDFAALLLLGPAQATVVAATSAFFQSTVVTKRHNPLFRVAFNVGALILTVQAAGFAFEYLGGQHGTFHLLAISRPLVASALLYYVCNTALVGVAVALTTRQNFWTVWHSNFLWTAPSYFVGAGAAAGAMALWTHSERWLLPLAIAPVYLTFRWYRIYLDRFASEKRHHEEVVRLHTDTKAALEAARQSEQRYALAAAGSNDGLWDWEITTDALYCSDRWKLMIGLDPETSISTFDQWLEYVDPEDQPSFRTALDSHLKGESAHFEHEYRVRHVAGEIRWVLCRGIAVRDDEGQPVRMAGSQTDITESRRVQNSLERAAKEDPLTGLPNRRLFSDLLQQAMARHAESAAAAYAVLFIDLDGFKVINDSLGHLMGDHFLITIARRLQSHLRPGDVLARVGGDEFAVLIGNNATPQDVRGIVERLQQALKVPFMLGSREVYGSASIGIVFGGPHYQSVDDLLRDADTAMYRSKSAGRGGYELFDPSMHASAVQRLTIETELRRAVERFELVVYYQPIVELLSSDIQGFEALVRWLKPDGTLVLPAHFIDVAEETGLIVPLTYQVLQEACRQTAQWQKLFGHPLHISVNVSSKLFYRPDFIDHVEDALRTTGLTRGTLKLEITESLLLKHSDTVDRNFEGLRKIGVAVHLDDFGTGYSSLSYLQRYQIDALKLDKSFVAQMGTGTSPIGNVIVRMAQELGMGLIAEGVETTAQAEALLALDCPHAQGLLFSGALPSAAAAKLLTKEFSGKAHRAAGAAPATRPPRKPAAARPVPPHAAAPAAADGPEAALVRVH